MSNPVESLWYVRIRGQTTGPLSRPELDNLIRAGALCHGAEVSSDGARWEPANLPPSPLVSTPSNRRPCEHWFHGLLVAVGFIMGAIAVLVALVVIGANIEAAPSQDLTPIVNRGDATWGYWRQSADIIDSASSAQDLNLANCERVAMQLQALGVDGVDPDVIALIMNVVSTIRLVVDTIQQQTVALEPATQRSAQSTQEGRSNETLWAPVEKSVLSIRTQLESTRVTLEQRYQREFPRIDF